jgi:hypothetical protein
MSRILRTSLLLYVVALAAGCSTTGRATNPRQSSPAVAQPAATTTASASAKTPTPVATLTAACPLLSVDELKTLLGGGASETKLEAVEDKPDRSGGYPSYTCEYGSSGKYPFALVVMGIKQAGFTPQVAVDAVAKGSDVKTHSTTGVGTAGVFYTTKDGYSVLAAGKRSHGQTRSVIFSAPGVVPEQKFIDVVRVVIDRI